MNCKITYHAKCVQLDKDDIQNVNFWYCSYCLGDIFVYNHIDDDNEFYSAILEGTLDHPFNVHEMGKKLFVPFEINDEFDTPLTEIDPDMQFYLESNYIKNTKCDYYIEDTFVKNISKIQEQKRALSMFHMNIKIYLNTLMNCNNTLICKNMISLLLAYQKHGWMRITPIYMILMAMSQLRAVENKGGVVEYPCIFVMKSHLQPGMI